MTIIKSGIDVSEHQQSIDWDRAKEQISFAMIRAGCGSKLDARAKDNSTQCVLLNIPYGYYWFSYAFNEYEAINEAKMLCDFADKFNPTYPICFDLEYDCLNRMKEHRINPTSELLCKIATAFMNYVEQRGYYAMFYTSLDMLKEYFNPLRGRYDMWLAYWNAQNPPVNCGIWQARNNAKIEGIKSFVDLNFAYKDYEKLTTKNKPSISTNVDELAKEIANQIFDEFDKVKVEILLDRVSKIISKYISK